MHRAHQHSDNTMPPTSLQRSSRTGRHWLLASLMAAVGAILAACKSTPVNVPPPPESRLPSDDAAAHSLGKSVTPGPSAASTARAYRRDAATHLYNQNNQRVFKGKLPPLLYAIGVLEVDIDRSGRITKLHWMRAPRHAPEVVAEIERTVRAAAPFPVPARMGRVTYTDTWLWDKSGHFQLDTLTEGQL
ncbi:hypothetical protein SAMN05421875_10254 [Acidovorax soli]|uniref:Protein TonB n=2 Tax=Comamonadaceae TaxID=80864 RepID=A0A1H3W3Q1_9BURK|nr:hypothetical protein SAMN05421875_10254 [Acidovorax soli]